MARLWKTALSGCVFAVALASAALLPQAASANPVFAQQTNEPCGACHLVGQDMGPAGLSPAGQTFLQAFNDCGSDLPCAVSRWTPPPPPPPAAPPAPHYNVMRQSNGTAGTSFSN